jgi:starvation-inducible outer membrane lipoprotein
MPSYDVMQRCTAILILTMMMIVAVGGCSSIPRRYLWVAERDVTLTMLSTNPEPYVGKVVLLGGTITDQIEKDQFLFLRLKNRPLDQDYKPHRPADLDSAEAGSYWVIVSKQQVPPKYREWARMTVVGRVTGQQQSQTEPVLMLLYMRGWGASGNHAGLWENIDPNYVPSVPGSIDMRNP